MVEKFSDYEAAKYIDKEGEFTFTIDKAELKDSSKGSLMWELEVSTGDGMTKVYHSLAPKARWSFNNLIKACLKLITPEQIAKFECDYETIGQQLVGKKFIGVVEAQSYMKDVKKPNDDGTFSTVQELRESYKIVEYKPILK